MQIFARGQKQMEIAGDFPDFVIGCTGGGSNFAGLALPFVREKLAGADRHAVQHELMPYRHLLPERYRGLNERIDERLP